MIDTHCHIDDPQYQADFDGFILTQQQGGVEAILVPGVNEESCTTVLATCARYPHYLYPALGLHPEDVRSDYSEVLDRIHQAILTAMASEDVAHRLVAIGEIGLDYHFSTEFKNEQIEAFRIQLAWARDLNLPIMLHARDATDDTLRVLRDFNLRGVAHCFSGSYETAQEYLKLGFYLGIGGVLTFKNCKLAETLCPRLCSDPNLASRPSIPLERLILETDAPYMAPVPYRGKPNESRWISYVVDKLADIYQVSPQTVIERTNANAKALFDLK